MKTSFYISIKILIVLTVLTGVLYPLVITGIGLVLFPGRANGSLISIDGRVIGSKLIGQQFDSSIYFHSRPSFINYNPLPSGASNYGPTSAKLDSQRIAKTAEFIKENGLNNNTTIPGDMIFASASGLDPQISPESALLQVNRIVKARGWNENRKGQVIALVKRLTEKPELGVLGNERVNVLLLNLELDKIK